MGMKSSFKDRARMRFASQVRWIVEHGSTLEGYVARYGSREDPDHYGSGGEAIYAADLKALLMEAEHAEILVGLSPEEVAGELAVVIRDAIDRRV